MNLNNKRFFVYQLFMIMILVTFSQIVSAKPLNQMTFQCIQSFENFAYGIQEDFTEADQLDIVWLHSAWGHIQLLIDKFLEMTKSLDR